MIPEQWFVLGAGAGVLAGLALHWIVTAGHDERMAPPTIRATAQDTAAAVSYSPRRGDPPPAAGDLIVMILPPEQSTPTGWTRNGPVLYRYAVGDERTFPGPAAWYRPADAGPDGTADPRGTTW